MYKVINGIQQIGIGVQNVNEVFNWYRQYLGFDILVFKDEATSSLMTKYTAEKAEDRIAYLSLNMIGGGGLEIWQFKDRTPEPPKGQITLGDLGIHMMKVRSNDISTTYQRLQSLDLQFLTSIILGNNRPSHFFFKDPWNNIVQVVEDSYCFSPTSIKCGGVMGAVLGVSNMDVSIQFYKEFLGFDRVVYDCTDTFDDFSMIDGGTDTFRRVLLQRSNTEIGGFGALLGPCEIELIQTTERIPKHIYQDRLWGDLGYIHLCFDVRGMKQHREDANALGYPFTVDSSDSFDMGDAAGHFSYVEDPDGTLLEFVETHKVPIVKKLGIFINMKNRSSTKPLPRWLVKAMKIHKVKRDL